MLKEFIAQKHVTLNGIVGIYPANAVGDDIEVYADEDRGTATHTFYGLRQQSEKDDKADPCAPASLAVFLIANNSLLLSITANETELCELLGVRAGTSACQTSLRQRKPASRTTWASSSTLQA